MVKDLWKRHLRFSAVLSVLLVAIWFLQGLQGLGKLWEYNSAQSRYSQIPIWSAVEGWMFGKHPVAVIDHFRKYPITVSNLQLDFGMDTALVEQKGQLHRLLMSSFLHGSVVSLLFNFRYLSVAARLEAGSRWAFLCIFLLSGIGGNLFLLATSTSVQAFGASVPICGLIGFEIIAFRRMQRLRDFRKVVRSLFGVLAVSFFTPGVSNVANIGGLFSGMLLALLTGRRSGFRSALVPWPIIIGCVLISSSGRHFLVALGRGLALGIAHPGLLAKGAVIS